MFKKALSILFITCMAVTSFSQLKIFSTEYKFVNSDSCPIQLVDTWGQVLSSDRNPEKNYRIAHEVKNVTGRRVISWEAKAVILDKFNRHLYTLSLIGDEPIDVADDEIIRSEFPNCGAWQCDLYETAYVYITRVTLDDRTEWNYDFDYVYNQLTTKYNLNLPKLALFTYVEKNRGLHKKYLGLKERNEDSTLSTLPRSFQTFNLMMSIDELKDEIAKVYPESLPRVYSTVPNSFNWAFELFFIDRDNIKQFVNDLETTPSKLHLNKITFESVPDMQLIESMGGTNYSLKAVDNRNLHGLANVINTTYFTKSSFDAVKTALIGRFGEPLHELDIRETYPTSDVELVFSDGDTAVKVILSDNAGADYYVVEKTDGVTKLLTLIRTGDAKLTDHLTHDRNYFMRYQIPFKVTRVDISYLGLKEKEEESKTDKVEIDF